MVTFEGVEQGEFGDRCTTLKKLKVGELKTLAETYHIDVRPEVLSFTTRAMVKIAGGVIEGKDLLVMCIAKDTKRLPTKDIGAIVAKVISSRPPKDAAKTRGADANAETDERIARGTHESPPVAASVPMSAQMTPTLEPSRTVPQIAFHEVVAYLESYRFISRYSSESEYEIELAGAMRERFGTIKRQYPVPVQGAGLRIDLDVGGIGIELKFELGGETARQRVFGQLEQYRQHYGEKLVLLLVASPGNEEFRHKVESLGVYVIEK